MALGLVPDVDEAEITSPGDIAKSIIIEQITGNSKIEEATR